MNPKYVVIKRQGNGFEEMIIFPPTIKHTAIVCEGDKLVSAGVISLGGDFCCYGESTSLRVKSRPGVDSRIADRMFNL